MSKSIRKPNFIDVPWLNPRLRYNCLQFWKTNVSHIGILLPVATSTTPQYNWRAILHRTTKCHPNRTTRGDSMTCYRFLKWQSAAQYYFRFRIGWYHSLPQIIFHRHILKNNRPSYWTSTFGFAFGDLALFRRSCLSATKFHSYNLICGRDFFDFRFEKKQTSAMLEFYFRFRFRPYYRSRCQTRVFPIHSLKNIF